MDSRDEPPKLTLLSSGMLWTDSLSPPVTSIASWIRSYARSVLSFTSRGQLGAAGAIPSKQVAYQLINSLLRSANSIIYRLCKKLYPIALPARCKYIKLHLFFTSSPEQIHWVHKRLAAKYRLFAIDKTVWRCFPTNHNIHRRCRHRAPVLSIQRMLFTTSRRSRSGLPVRGFSGGSSSFNESHCSLLKSRRVDEC
jgi:hypothetical protein